MVWAGWFPAVKKIEREENDRERETERNRGYRDKEEKNWGEGG